VRVKELPITPMKIIKMIEEKGATKKGKGKDLNGEKENCSRKTRDESIRKQK
jgi:hypothetical protein